LCKQVAAVEVAVVEALAQGQLLSGRVRYRQSGAWWRCRPARTVCPAARSCRRRCRCRCRAR
jgi:hypothetical protein